LEQAWTGGGGRKVQWLVDLFQLGMELNLFQAVWASDKPEFLCIFQKKNCILNIFVYYC